MPLDRSTLLDRLRVDAVAMVEALPGLDLSVPVPSCPGWTTRDLVGHLGSVHRWATDIVRTGRPGEEPPFPGGADELVAWFSAGVPSLLAALETAVPGSECWTFGPRPRVVDFWIRRQALETTVHRWDLLDALGARAGLAADLAADGVDEVATMMFPRQVRLGRVAPLAESMELVCVESGQRSLIGGDGIDPPLPAAVTLTGPASDLLLLLWRRIPLDAPRLTVSGDDAVADRIVAVALTP